jgi:hypothetical protein
MGLVFLRFESPYFTHTPYLYAACEGGTQQNQQKRSISGWSGELWACAGRMFPDNFLAVSIK